MNRKQLKRDAKSQLKGNWSWAICLYIISSLIISLINGINKEIIVPNKTLQNLNLSEKTIYSITTFLITTFITTIIS